MVRLERDGAVFVLHLGRGENRVDAEFLGAVHARLDEVEASTGDAALVTVGAGRFYSTGLDLEALIRVPSRAGGVMSDLHRLLARLLVFPLVTVAAVNGHAFAAGAMIALAHDFRLMRADRGWLCLPEIDLGTGRPLTPGMYALLGARLSRAVLAAALFRGDRYTASEAVALDFVHEAAVAAELLPRAVERARSLAGKDRRALGALKDGLYATEVRLLSREVAAGG